MLLLNQKGVFMRPISSDPVPFPEDRVTESYLQKQQDKSGEYKRWIKVKPEREAGGGILLLHVRSILNEINRAANSLKVGKSRRDVDKALESVDECIELAKENIEYVDEKWMSQSDEQLINQEIKRIKDLRDQIFPCGKRKHLEFELGYKSNHAYKEPKVEPSDEMDQE
jgi:hypothetical protein